MQMHHLQNYILKQEYWSELLISSPGDLPDRGIKLWSPALQADSLLSEPPEKFPKTNEIFRRCKYIIFRTIF